MIYLTPDCHILPLTGLNASVYTGLTAKKLYVDGYENLCITAPILRAPLCGANNIKFLLRFADTVLFCRYVDHQRDMGVVLGERDIRREIMKHRGRFLKCEHFVAKPRLLGKCVEVVSALPIVDTFYLF